MTEPFAILFWTRNFLVMAVAVFLVAGNCACRRGSNRNNANASASSSGGESAADKSKREAQAFVDQGKEFYKNDQDDRAAQAFQEAIRLSPDLAEAHLRLGMAYAALDKKTEADQSYKK